MRRGMLVLLLTLATAAAAEAQTEKQFSLGAGIGFHNYSDSRFTSKELDIVPMYRFSRTGEENGWDWDLKSSIGFSVVDAPTDLAGAEVRLGRLRTIPLLFGVARGYRHGPMKIGAWVTGGPSFNNLEIDPDARTAYEAAGSSLDAVHAKTSFAFRPGVSASFRLSSLFALQGSVSYTINRPTVLTRIDGVSTSETWKLDRSSATVGMVLGIF
jgi:hypothetical protein